MRNINIALLCAGASKRFRDSGYAAPKPFIEIYPKRTMIEEVINNLKGSKHSSEFNFIIVTQSAFLKEYNTILNKILENAKVRYEIRTVDKLTEGSACTALIVKDLIENDDELILTDVDHLCLDKDHIINGVNFFRTYDADCGFWVFHGTDPKFSFVKVDGNNNVIDVAEKKPISEIANVGSYYWKRGKDFVKYAQEMIKKQDKTLNEYYLSPVARGALVDDLVVKPFYVNMFFSLGTPQLLNDFLEKNK